MIINDLNYKQKNREYINNQPNLIIINFLINSYVNYYNKWNLMIDIINR